MTKMVDHLDKSFLRKIQVGKIDYKYVRLFGYVSLVRCIMCNLCTQYTCPVCSTDRHVNVNSM